MKTAWCFLLACILLLSACVMSSVQNERNADGSKAEVALYPSEAAPFYLAAALIDSAGRTINTISGTVYCGNLKETLRPELVKNHAQVDFWVK